MNDFKNCTELNKKIENSPKAMGCWALSMKIMSILLILMSAILCLAVPVVGIIGIAFGVLLFYLARKAKFKDLKNLTWKEERIVFEFPDTDKQGNPRLNVYDLNVTGVLHEQNGIDPQTIIPKLYEGEQLVLEADPLNSNDKYAVKVKTVSGIQIGWLPKGENLQIDISNRLTSGQNVYARVKRGYLLDNYPGKVGLVIDVARYSKK